MKDEGLKLGRLTRVIFEKLKEMELEVSSHDTYSISTVHTIYI